MYFACCNVLVVLDVFVGCDGVESSSRRGILICVSGGFVIPCNDAGSELCVLFLGAAVECCIDNLACGGGDQWERVVGAGIAETCI